ncbi:MAG: allantoate amidohydrolase [Microlunatus sp.]|nr:allantoate amidohydrolase [Microlunatus sp.]MDN5770656.1 allantoate amidohydrolase [Microlunatus sp.]
MPGVVTFDQLWSDLADVGRSPDTGGYRRYALSAEDHLLREWFAGEAERRGLDLVTDRMGNQWAWWGDPDTTPGVVTGSHLDSVPDGGAFDGPLGVVSALAAVDRLRADGFVPARPIGVVNFSDEEGARFGVACAGSRVITGAMTAERALGLTDEHGISMAEALRSAGRDPVQIGADPQALRRIGCFVELHVEQGRGLIDLDQPVAIGTDIWPHGRWRIDFPGEANHAGTTRLVDREDAMIGLASTVLAARSAATTQDCVATVGKTLIVPGGVNAIPSSATAWLDTRGSDEAAVRRTVAEVTSAAEPFGARFTEESWTPTTRFDPDLLRRLQRVLPEAPLLGTGAGHDAGILATAGIPSAMIFVLNPTGISHSPAEHAERDDCLTGVAALVAVLADLAGERS